MLKTRLKTALFLILGMGVLSLPAQADHKHDTYPRDRHNQHVREDVTIAVVTRHGHRALRHSLIKALRHKLPNTISIVHNPSRADYILDIRERRFDTNLRVKDRDHRWFTAPYNRKRHHARRAHPPQRIGWTEVSAIALARYKYTVTLKDRYGRVIDKDRIKGRVRDHVAWGEDLRIATRHGFRPYHRYPNAQIEALFNCAPGTGGGPYATLHHKLAGELAYKIAAKTLDTRTLYAHQKPHHHPQNRYGVGYNFRKNWGFLFK